MRIGPHKNLASYFPEIIERLIPLNPKSINVFGSSARGTSDRGSDIDLLVILDSNEVITGALERVNRKIRFRKAIMEISYEVPIDLIIMTEAEVKRAKREGNTFFEAILKTGNHIYERAYGSVA